MGAWFNRTVVMGRRIDLTPPSWAPFTVFSRSIRWRHAADHARFRRHRFGLLDVDESLRRVSHLSNRRYAYRLPTP
jgi:hypothetical protein